MPTKETPSQSSHLRRLLRIMAIVCTTLLAVCAGCNCGDDCKEEIEERCEKECDRVGTCAIKYTFSEGGELTKTARECRWIRADDVDLTQCGVCTDVKTDDNGNVTAKTCQVCNLCSADFECFEDSECDSAIPVCDRGICVGCENDAHCQTDGRDPNTPACLNNKCIACTKDTHCTDTKNGAACLNNQCVGCTENSHCEGNETRKRCDTKTNKCVACLDDTQCEDATKPQCDQSECVPCRCSAIDETKPYCIKNKDFSVSCVECQADTDCSSTSGRPVCDLTTGTCVAQCQADTDCTGDLFCVSGACVECQADTDCRDDQTPSCINGTCGCAKSEDCPTSLPQCTNSRCVECVRDRDCTAGFPLCNKGVCELLPCKTNDDCNRGSYNRCERVGPGNFCVQCLNDSHCTEGDRNKCDTGTWSCVK